MQVQSKSTYSVSRLSLEYCKCHVEGADTPERIFQRWIRVDLYGRLDRLVTDMYYLKQIQSRVESRSGSKQPIPCQISIWLHFDKYKAESNLDQAPSNKYKAESNLDLAPN